MDVIIYATYIKLRYIKWNLYTFTFIIYIVYTYPLYSIYLYYIVQYVIIYVYFDVYFKMRKFEKG